MIELRSYQEKTVEWVLARAAANPSARLLIVLPAGGGKTAIAAALMKYLVADQAGMRGLFVAHRIELLGQAHNSMIGVGIDDERIGDFDGDFEDLTTDERIVLASVDLLRQGTKLPDADLLITDEAHRDAGDFRRQLRKHYSNVLRVGFTATPERLDGKSLKEDFDEMYVAARPSELIAAGYLMAPRVFTVPKEKLPDLRGIRSRAGDFDPKELEARSNKPALLGDIVQHWIQRAEKRKTMAFVCSRRHSIALVARFKARGISAEHLDGKVGKEERKTILAAFKAGKISVISSCDLLSEGIDIPSVKCVIMARPTASLVIVNQQAGRCMRPCTEDRRSALILDHAGNTVRHGYPHADREWSLDSFKSRPVVSNTIRPDVCSKCHAVVPDGLKCGECTEPAFIPFASIRGMLPVELPGELIPIAHALPLSQRTREYNKLLAFAKQRGFGEKWANRVYIAKFGESLHGSVKTAS
jgi:DNA repair protein RadD